MNEKQGERSARYLKVFQSRAYIIVNLAVLTLMFFVIWRLHAAVYATIFRIVEYVPPADFNLGLITSIVILIIYMGIALFTTVQWRNTYYEVYTDRFVIRRKVISEKTTSVTSSDFITIDVAQGIIGKIFKYGDITFNFRIPVEGGERAMANISDPYEQIKIVNEILGKTKRASDSTTEAVSHVDESKVQVGSELKESGQHADDKAFIADMLDDQVPETDQNQTSPTEPVFSGRIDPPDNFDDITD
ncbi:PH domain-containing protein [Patescibacteria group bacterium]